MALSTVLLSSASPVFAQTGSTVDVDVRLERTEPEASLRVEWMPATACRSTQTGREWLLTCEHGVNVRSSPDLGASGLQWRAGFDSLLVSSNTDLRAHDDPTGGVRLTASAEVVASRSDARSQRRLDLLRAQWWHYDGRSEMARALLATLESAEPNSPDIRAFLARIDLERGRTRRAEETYRAALTAAPRRTDLKRAVAELARQRAPAIEFERNTRRVGGVWTESHVIVGARSEIQPHLVLAGKIDRVTGRVDGVRLRSGDIATAAVDQTLVEGSLEYQLARGTRVRSGAAAGPSGLGAFGGVEFVNSAGRTIVSAEANRPFGEFLEGAAQAGSRDRFEITRQQTLGSRGGAWVVAARSRYRLAGEVWASSLAFTAGGVFQVVRRNPSVSLQYGYDLEQPVRLRTVATEGGSFAPLNVSPRRVHVAGLNVVQGIGNGLRVDVSGGYAFDQLGGRGTFGQARLWSPTPRRFNADLWAEYRLHVLTTAQRAARGGARMWVSF